MRKSALDIDPRIVGRYALGGALFGGGIAGLINLAHTINILRAKRARALAELDTDKDTIVLTLPEGRMRSDKDRRKTAADDPPTPCAVEGPEVREFAVHSGPRKGQSREIASGSATGAGRFGPKLCEVEKASEERPRRHRGWPTLTASMVAAVAAGVGGAALVNKLYDIKRERRMRAELEAARKEYMDLLSGKVSAGSDFVEGTLGGSPEGEKHAADTFGVLNYPLAAFAFLSLLGAGATGYITKRILDEKLQEDKERAFDVPKVKRIVFRSRPTKPEEGKEEDPEKKASAEEIESVSAGLMAMMDRVADSDRFTGSPEVTRVLATRGETREDLVKMADDWDVLRTHLENAPDLRRALHGLYVRHTSNPIIGFFKRMALRIPAIRRRADERLFDTLEQLRVGGRGRGRRSGAPRPPAPPEPPMSPHKMAQDATSALGLATPASPVTALAGSLLGGAAGRELLDGALSPEELAMLIVRAQDKAQHARLLKTIKEPGTVRIEAHDPEAREYLAENKERIKEIVKRLAKGGQM